MFAPSTFARWNPVAVAWTSLIVVSCLPGIAQGQKISDPADVDEDYRFQGEYTGELDGGDGATEFGVQIIALGKGEFRAVAYPGGLPGEGAVMEEKIEPEQTGKRDGDQVVFETDMATAIIKDGSLYINDLDGNPMGTLSRVERRSRTLGKEPVEGAIVLFDGTNAEGWKNGRMTENGLLMEGTTSIEEFGSHQLHIEFRLPYQPQDRNQGRGNSGIYLQGRYEIQMLDSFGLEGKHNECGGLYSVKDPDVNMCYPPLTWQTFDIEFTAAKFNDDGELVANPRVTVHHNGVLIHNDIELPGERSTTAAPNQPGGEPGPVFLQDHGCPVRYRNIWVKPTE